MMCLLAASRTGDRYVKELEAQCKEKWFTGKVCVVRMCTAEYEFFK